MPLPPSWVFSRQSTRVGAQVHIARIDRIRTSSGENRPLRTRNSLHREPGVKRGRRQERKHVRVSLGDDLDGGLEAP